MPLDLWKLKLICGFVIFVVTFIPSILPFKLFSLPWARWFSFCCSKKDEEEEGAQVDGEAMQTSILGHLMCFGGGVFFGTYLLHMSVEVHFILSHTQLDSITYPVPSLLIGIGFFLVLGADQLVSSCRMRALEIKKQKRKKQGAVNDTNFSEDSTACTEDSSAQNDFKNSVYTLNGIAKTNVDIEAQYNHHDNNIRNHNGHNGHSHNGHSHNDQDKDVEAADLEELHQHQHATRSIVLVLALSLHHIFEGMSISLQHDYDDVWRLTLAVLIHEVVICFSLGLQFFKSDRQLTKKVFVILLIAACILPLGVFIGIGISEAPNQDPSKSDLVNGVLQAIATGTFIYVTFFEILLEELGGNKSTLSRVLATILGFTLMALLGLIDDGSGDNDVVANTTMV